MFKWQDWTESMEVPLEPVYLFESLNRLRRLLSSGRGGDHPSAPTSVSAAENPSVEKPRSRFRSLRAQVRDRLRHAVAARALARVARLTPFLSADRVLENRLDRAEEIMRGIARDYGEGRPSSRITQATR